MIERLQSNFSVDFYKTPDRVEMLENKTVHPNIYAVTLVLRTMQNIYNRTISLGQALLNGARKLGKFQVANTKSALKQFYIISAKLYMVDFFLFAAFFQSPNDLFYKPIESNTW